MKAHLITLLVMDHEDYGTETVLAVLETTPVDANTLSCRTINIPNWTDKHYLNYRRTDQEIKDYFTNSPDTKITYQKE